MGGKHFGSTALQPCRHPSSRRRRPGARLVLQTIFLASARRASFVRVAGQTVAASCSRWRWTRHGGQVSERWCGRIRAEVAVAHGPLAAGRRTEIPGLFPTICVEVILPSRTAGCHRFRPSFRRAARWRLFCGRSGFVVVVRGWLNVSSFTLKDHEKFMYAS